MALRKRHPDWYRADLGTLFQLLAERAIHPRIAERIGLAGVPDAHRRIEAGGLTGKIVICPPTESYTPPSQADRGTVTHTARGLGTLDSDRARRVIR